MESLREELSSLRSGRGATVTKLKNCPLLLTVLGTEEPTEALRRLTDAVKALGEHPHALALRNAFALDMSNPGTLTERRGNYGAALPTFKAPDTIKGWEDQMIHELVLQLEWARSGLLHVDLLAEVVDGQLLKVNIYRTSVDDGHLESQAQYTASEVGALSATCCLWQAPMQNDVERFTVSVEFIGTPPREIWTDRHADLAQLLVGFARQSISLDEAQDSWGAVAVNEQVIPSWYYGLFWTF